MKNILFININKSIYTKNFFSKLKKEFPKINFIILDQNNKNKFFSKIHSAEAIINCPKSFCNIDLLRRGKKLKWIHSGRAGVEDYLFPEFVRSNILFTNGKILQGPEIADHAIGLLLTISRNIHFHVREENLKNIARPIELNKKKCAILGLGGIGYCIAERLKSFGVAITGFSEELVPLVSYIDEVYTIESLKKYLNSFDVVISALPLTKNTYKLCNESFFKKMKKDSIFINVSRGKIVDTKALLRKKLYTKFRGIGLDVTDPEVIPKSHQLRKAKNIIITNHTSGLSDRNRDRSKYLVKKNIERFLLGKPLLNVVDKIKGY